MRQTTFPPPLPLLPKLPEGMLDRLLRIDQLKDVWRKAMKRHERSIHDRVIAELDLRVEHHGNLSCIPTNGPLVIVANHPFGIVEGPTLGALLEQVRPDVRFVTNSLLSDLPELRDRIIAVNPLGGAAVENSMAIRAALHHLRGGGALVVFPAGEVSAMRAPFGQVRDAEWQPMAARLAMKTGARVLPVYFAGRNRSRFQIAGLVHPALRTMLIPSEMLCRRNQTIRVVIGQPECAAKFRDAESLTSHLRRSTYQLARQLHQRPIAQSRGATAIAAEVSGLTPILESEKYLLFLERAHKIPVTLEEIGRLREVTFRAVGEGSGKALDLDEYDTRYWHLFLWHKDDREVAGAYRLTDSIGSGGYCQSLFHFPRHWSTVSSRAVELGRSFIAAPYQRDFLPLLTIWKGIGHFVLARPHIRYLLGAVSISASYTPAARALIAGSLAKRRTGIRPRNLFTFALSYRPGARALRDNDDLEVLANRVAQLEPDGKGLPVLLRQYTSLGGQILCMNLDPLFGDTLDGLVLLDLHQVPPRMMRRYFGEEGCERFCPNRPLP